MVLARSGSRLHSAANLRSNARSAPMRASISSCGASDGQEEPPQSPAPVRYNRRTAASHLWACRAKTHSRGCGALHVAQIFHLPFAACSHPMKEGTPIAEAQGRHRRGLKDDGRRVQAAFRVGRVSVGFLWGIDFPWSTKCLIFLVGVAGFEPATPSSRTMCATRLRYTP